MADDPNKPRPEENPTRAFAKAAREAEIKIRAEREAARTQTAPKATETPAQDNPVDEPKAQPQTDQAQTAEKPAAQDKPADAAPPPPAKATETPEQVKPKSEAKVEPAQVKTGEEREAPRTSAAWEAYKKADRERLDAIAKERDSLKAQYENALKERDAIKAEIEKTKGYIPPTQIDNLQKELEEVTNRLRLAKLEADPRFSSYYENEINERINRVKQRVDPDKAAAIEAIVRLPDGKYKDQQLEEFMADLSTMQQARIGALMEEIAGKQAERDNEIKKWRERGKELEAQQTAQERAAEQERARKFEMTLDEIMTQLPENDALKPVWDDEMRRMSKSILLKGMNNREDLNTVADLVSKGIAYHKILSMLKTVTDEKEAAEAAWTKEKEELTKQTKSLEAAQPSLSKATQAPETPSDEEPPKNATPRQLSEWLQRRASRVASERAMQWASGR